MYCCATANTERRVAEIEAAVADDLHHQPVGRRELGAERHAAGPAEPAAAGAHQVLGTRPRDLQQHRAGVADAFVEDDVVGVEHLAELGQQIVRVDRAGLALVGGELGGARDALVASRLDALRAAPPRLP